MTSFKPMEFPRRYDPYFPVRRRLISLHDIRPIVTPHWHEEAELIRILDGHCTCRVNLEQLDAGPGDLFFVPPQALHSLIVSPDETMHAEIYEFRMSFLGNNTEEVCSQLYLTPLTAHRLVTPSYLSQPPELAGHTEEIYQKLRSAYLSKAPGYELRVKAELLLLIAELIPYSQKASGIPTVKTENLDKIKKALEYIEYHYAKNITIEELAELCQFTTFHFMRFFKQYAGMHCTEYVTTLRLEKAGKLLIAGQTPQAVTSATGFASVSYFYRTFKKLYHMTPREFQERSQQLEDDEWGVYGQILVPARNKSQK